MAYYYKTLLALISVGGFLYLALYYFPYLSVVSKILTTDKVLPSRNYEIIKKYMSMQADQWIVVTTVSHPTPDIKFLAEIPGWKVVVVGDTKTPRNWSYPNCVFLSIEDQQHFGFHTVPYLPEKSYARKSVGYLFAIAHGAKVIYETDDDNRPLDLLRNFVLEPTMWGLLYEGERVFNPYRHFGQPTLWPRGYPLSSVGGTIVTKYRFNQWKTPSIQQGVVNGDPDMDAIFRLTRKQTVSVLNVTFDGRAPPAIVPAGVFSPFNSQNTLFLYDALWALLIPTTTSFRVCDIWRGYWAQRLLWEMGGNLGFFPPNAFQKRNSHSYLLDAVDEKDLYFETERLVEFLTQWRCDARKAFFDCVIQLSADMTVSGFWRQQDVELTKAWVTDLKALGYKEPVRIRFGSLKDGARSTKGSTLPKQTRSSSQQVMNLTFWAAEQVSPQIYHKQRSDTALVSHASDITSYCRTVGITVPLVDITTTINTFPNILLIVVFNTPHYENIHFLEIMYSMHFPHIVYCGIKKRLLEEKTKFLQKPVTFIEVDVGDGWFSQNCLTQAMKMNYKVDGYLYMGDDVLLNVWTLHQLPWDKLWLTNDTILRQSVKSNWYFHTLPIGMKAYQSALAATKFLNKRKWDKFFRTLAENTGYPDGLYKGFPDIFYVPKRHKDDVLYFVEHFSKFNVFVALAIPTSFVGIEKFENIHYLKGNYLWYNGKREHYEQFFSKHDTFLHPVKVSKALSTTKGREFFCMRYLPLTMQKLHFMTDVKRNRT